MAIPKYDQLFNTVLEALRLLGGSATNQELEAKVIQLLDLPGDEAYERLEGKSQTRLGYRTAWAKSYLKAYGLLDNTERGVWALNAEGKRTPEVDSVAVKAAVRGMSTAKNSVPDDGDQDFDVQSVDHDSDAWRDRLLSILLEVTPDAFERLGQRLLRESGFSQVEVTGRSGDGGIDGHGVLKLQGLLSFHVYFQCKRYRNSVGASVVRDFRGAMMGRADKGLIITTGTFTRDAIAEATRDGATPIDLIDGSDLVDRLKELGLGVFVTKRVVEEIAVDDEWYRDL